MRMFLKAHHLKPGGNRRKGKKETKERRQTRQAEMGERFGPPSDEISHLVSKICSSDSLTIFLPPLPEAVGRGGYNLVLECPINIVRVPILVSQRRTGVVQLESWCQYPFSLLLYAEDSAAQAQSLYVFPSRLYFHLTAADWLEPLELLACSVVSTLDSSIRVNLRWSYHLSISVAC